MLSYTMPELSNDILDSPDFQFPYFSLLLSLKCKSNSNSLLDEIGHASILAMTIDLRFSTPMHNKTALN